MAGLPEGRAYEGNDGELRIALFKISELGGQKSMSQMA